MIICLLCITVTILSNETFNTTVLVGTDLAFVSSKLATMSSISEQRLAIGKESRQYIKMDMLVFRRR